MWLKYADQPILNGEHWDRDQPSRLSEHEKPRGFWITDDSEDCWRAWCVGARFGLEELTHKHEIILDESNLLILRSVGEIDLFTKEFAVERPWRGQSGQRYVDRCIDWRAVAARYDGLIITPYQWQRRLCDGYSWYYGWDCASGCIWRARAIKEIRLIDIDREIANQQAAAA